MVQSPDTQSNTLQLSGPSMNDKPSAVPLLGSHAADCAVLSRAQPAGTFASRTLRLFTKMRPALPAALSLVLPLAALRGAAARVGGHRHDGDLAGVDLSRVGLPTWTPTYNARASTAFMPCNYSGFFNATFAASFGVSDFE